MIFWLEQDISSRINPPKPAGNADDWFGYLPQPVEIQFNAGRIEPVENYDDVQGWVAKHRYVQPLGNRDGTLYPPMVQRGVHDPRTKELQGFIPQTEQPSLVHPVPASHALYLTGVPSDTKERRLRLAGFVVHLVGYLYDTRQQFHDWWFDTAVPIAEMNLYPPPAVANDFVSRALTLVRAWPVERQRFITNLLYMHCRASSYRWYWERFIAEYVVTDACYRLAENLGEVNAQGHAKRILAMCHKWGVRADAEHEATVNRIVHNRNAFLHTALWEGNQPSGGTSSRAVHDVRSLHKLNQRFICAVLGYRNQFVRSAWDTFGSPLFDRAP